MTRKKNITNGGLRRLFLASIYMLGILGIVASGGGGGSSGGDDSDPVVDSKCEIGSSKLGDCKI